jgi:hypothetical protein
LTPRLIIACLSAGACLGVACATLGGGGGGAEDLPNRGIVPYDKVELDHDGDPETAGLPWVLTPEDRGAEEFLAPSAVVRGGRVELYSLTHRLAKAAGPEPGAVAVTEAWWIDRAISDDGGLSFGPRVAVLTADHLPDWVERVGPPGAWVEADGTTLMAIEVGARAAIALARSADGVTFQIDAAPALLPTGAEPGLGNPSLLRTERGLELFYDVDSAAGPRRVARAVFDEDKGAFVRHGIVLAAPSTDCVDAFGEPEKCWDSAGVWSPEVRWALTGAGRRVYRMFYAGASGSKADIGFAASFDGQVWERYAYNPVLDDAASETDPSNVRLADRYLLFAFERRSLTSHGIILAIDDAGWPSETF